MMHRVEPDAITINQQIWQQLELAIRNRGHGWRKPVLATVDGVGMPQARTVVLREVSHDQQKLVFYSDARSPKVSQLGQHADAVLVFWSEALAWQLRVKGTGQVEINGPGVEQRWQRISNTPAADDYLATRAPGTALENNATAQGHDRHHLAIISVVVSEIDWLALDREGHRRAIFSRNDAQWVVP